MKIKLIFWSVMFITFTIATFLAFNLANSKSITEVLEKTPGIFWLLSGLLTFICYKLWDIFLNDIFIGAREYYIDNSNDIDKLNLRRKLINIFLNDIFPIISEKLDGNDKHLLNNNNAKTVLTNPSNEEKFKTS